MKLIVRACGLAAAALALAATATLSAPLMAGAAGADQPTATYLDHASATLPAGPEALDMLVAAHAGADTRDPEQECLAGAVYFEARGEPVEGQLAVAEVVLNRAASGRYPASICDVVTQRAQFSFILDGKFPPVARGSVAWEKAVAIATIAQARLAARVPSDVLWYHADYVAPVWRHGLTRVTKIGAHIFYS